MRKKEKNIAHFIMLLLITAFVLIMLNIIIFTIYIIQWKDSAPIDFHIILDDISNESGEYSLSEDSMQILESRDLFAMIISQQGDILFEERLPEELNKKYTLQDVAMFARYYLDDYPVHTYIVPEGLLVIGNQKGTMWKYTLEYSESMVRQLVKQLPVILLVNMVLLISLPLFIQHNWIKKREEERTEWIAGVSHDIRTPLTLILGNADYISQNAEDPLLSEKANAIEQQSLKIRSLVTNLNTSSKLDFGMGNYAKSSVKISSIIRKILTDFLNMNSEDKYSFSLEINDDLQELFIGLNTELFQRMLENLINNSIQHNPDGCDICIKFDRESSTKNRYILLVSDNGVGASPDTLKNLNRGSLRRPVKLDEHGIGLRLVKRIADYHSWYIHFSNNHPHGFMCRITIRT